MVRAALVLLTAIAVLWHATAGCCAHHEHAAAAAPATEPVSCGCHSHACGGEEPEDAASVDLAQQVHRAKPGVHLAQPDDSCRDACGERCSFPQPDGSGVSLLKHSLAACDLSLPFATLVGFSMLPPAERMREFDAPPPLHVGHALRRHLALGVLLV